LDIVGKIMPLLNSGAYYVRPDGRIATTIDRLNFDPPWIYVRPAPTRLCHIWHKIYFQHFNIIPSQCHQCWKVVIRPRTIEELFALYEYQMHQYNAPCKCGIEDRGYVEGIYGGYFYNDSLEAGKECLDKVIREFSSKFSPEMPIYLKRACTEFEQSWGDSAKWEISDDQKALEKTLNSIFVQDEYKMPQTDHLRSHVFKRWIHKAADHGDMTYLRFTDGVHLVPKIVKYFGTGDDPWQNIK
jgi:hypothetical protein